MTIKIHTFSPNIYWILIVISSLFFSCKKELKTVTVKEFSTFIDDTGYVTDAEKFGWSFVQKDVYNYDIVENATWKRPNGQDLAIENFPVTQVSYNDAIAYANWAKVSLPKYDEFWDIAKKDMRPIVKNARKIETVKQCNVIGNVWDITIPENNTDKIRLAGGSYLCSSKTCNGTDFNRELYVDKATGNSHISFSVY